MPVLIINITTKIMQVINVDDDSDDRNMFCWAIRKIDPGIQCIEIENAEKAIEFLRLSDIFPDFIFHGYQYAAH